MPRAPTGALWSDDSLGGPAARTRPGTPPRPRTRFPLEHLLTAGEDFVERVGEVRRALGELFADLHHVLLVALLDLFLESRLERAVLEARGALGRVVGDRVGNQRAGEPPRLDLRGLDQGRID